MLSLRCPQCHLPITTAESQSGTCPVCAATLAELTHATPAPASAVTPQPRRTPIFLLSAIVGGTLLSGALGGYYMGVLRAEDETTVAVKRVEELEALTGTLEKDVAAHKRHAIEETARTEAANRDAKLSRDQAIKPLDDRVKQLEARNQQLSNDIAAQKKETAESKAREEEALRSLEQARKPQENRAGEIVTLTKKMEALAKSITEAKAREDTARRTTEQVRQQGERALEQLRQQDQQALERLRQDSQRTIEQLRVQLRQQQQATQQALAEAAKQKKAAEEAQRKKK